MPIKETQIAIGYEYQAGNNQDRVVLGYTKDMRVVYATRGGNKKNPYDHRYTSKKETFAKACYARGAKLKPLALKQIIQNTHADSVIGK